jgi:hypothetical protein
MISLRLSFAVAVRSLPFLALLTLASVLPAPAPAAAQGGPARTNLLANPGFEDGGLFNPTDWDTTEAGVPTVLFHWDRETKRTGDRAASLINAGDAMPLWHNWSQTLRHAGRFAGRDMEFKVWVRSSQLSGGRGYILLQAYKDTIMNAAYDQGISRDEARNKMGYKYVDDPVQEMAWGRKYFSADLDDWVQQKVRMYIPPGTDLIVARCGIYGSGQVWFDDAELYSIPAAPPPALALGRNLLVNHGFEQPFDDWEFSIPPAVGAVITPDSTTARSGRRSVLLTTRTVPEFSTFMSTGQAFNARNLSGRRVRLSGWGKLENIVDSAYLSISSSGKSGVSRTLAGDALHGTLDWTFYSVEFDVPKDTYLVWARAGYITGLGRVWWDDLKFEVLGATPKATTASTRRRGR